MEEVVIYKIILRFLEGVIFVNIFFNPNYLNLDTVLIKTIKIKLTLLTKNEFLFLVFNTTCRLLSHIFKIQAFCAFKNN